MSICSTVSRELQGKLYILEDLHPSGGKNVLNMCDLFKDVYIYNFFGCNFTTQQCVVQSFCVKNEYVCMYVFNCLPHLSFKHFSQQNFRHHMSLVIMRPFRFSKTMKKTSTRLYQRQQLSCLIDVFSV